MPLSENNIPKESGARILVAEDNPAVREFIVRSLMSAGYKAMAVADGQQALDMLSKEKFDVLVTDIVMPNVDGIALALKAVRLFPDLRIVMISGYAQERMRAHNLDALVHRIIAKPFSLEEICDAVKDYRTSAWRHLMKPRIRKAVFPVAGLGTRFLPATKAMPKEMLTLVDRPLIQHAVDEARAAGIEQFIFVTSRGKGSLEDHFDSNHDLKRVLEARGKKQALEILATTEIDSGQLLFTRQREPLGLGHAVWCARHLVGDEPFAVLLADDVVLTKKPCLQQMIEAYNAVGGNLVGVVDVPREQTNRYGILDVESDDGKLAKIKGLVEKPESDKAPSTLSIIGRYILQPQIFDELEAKRVGTGGEIQLTDSMARLIGRQPFHGLRYEGTRYDCGDKIGFIEANAAFALASSSIGPQVRDVLKKLLA